jgi:Protein of unknown function (DUF2865)
MSWKSGKHLVFGAVALLSAAAVAPSAHAEDFLSSLFGAFGAHRPAAPITPLPFANEGDPSAPQQTEARPRVAYGGGGTAYCVRTCDGRYFPLAVSGNASRAASCNSFCPASETKVVYGSSIDNAATETGNPIPNCRTRFDTATRSSRAAPATAGTRSVSRPSASKTIRRCARVTSSPVPTG